MINGKIMPPTEPAVLPMPMTEATWERGKLSATVVKMFADQPWWAAAARLSSATMVHRLSM
ncbi:hypothetical protein D3C84_1314640 [compost metagenome]